MGDVYGGVTSAVGVIGKFEEVNGDGDGDGDGDGRWRCKRSAGRMARAWGLWAWRLARQKLLYLGTLPQGTLYLYLLQYYYRAL